MTLNLLFPEDPVLPVNQRPLTPEIQQQITTDTALVRSLFEDLAKEQANLQKYRDYYNGEQKLVFGTTKFKEFFPAFEGFEDNWCAVVVDAIAEKMKLLGIELDRPEGVDPDSEDERVKRIWNCFRLNNIDQQEIELTEGVFVEGRAAVIVWKDEKLGVRIDWQPAQTVMVRYSEDDWREVRIAMKRWVTPGGEIRVNIYDKEEVRKYVEGRDSTLPKPTSETGPLATIPDKSPTFSLQPRFVEGESWPLPHDFRRVPVVEFRNKRGSELSDVIPLQDAINYMIVSAFIAGEFAAVRQRVFFTHLKEPDGGWKNDPGRVWHLPPMQDPDGKVVHGEAYEFQPSELSQYRQIIEMVLQHLALSSKTPVRMFFKSDRGGRGDAPSGESELIEDEPLLDKAEDREVRLGNSWFEVARLVATGLGITEDLLGEMIWRDPRSKYRTALLDQAIKYANPKNGLGLPIEWVVKQLALPPEDLLELQRLMLEQDAEEEQARQEMLEATQANQGDTGLGADSADDDGVNAPSSGGTAPNASSN